MKKIPFTILFFLTIFFCQSQVRYSDPIRLLILSGSNNHDWHQTTPLLESIYKGSSRFEVEITNQPDTLVYRELKEFDAIVSNWNSWPEFDKISTGAWLEDTWHGIRSPVKVKIENHEHPVTKEFSDFQIFDELWINAKQNDRFQVLGSAINEEDLNKGYENQPAIFVSDYGKGRIFHTILGHDTKSMSNTGFQTLMLRGTEWAATSKVSLPIPKELQQK